VSPGAPTQKRRFWRRALWALVWPRRHERIQATLSGVVLMGLAMGVGTAAYNSASNILFIALALLLACLILSGVLSWLNLRRVHWQLDLQPPLRAGQAAEVGLVLRNRKGILPTYALWFEFFAAPVPRGEPARPETTFTSGDIDWREVMRRKEEGVGSGEVHLRSRLDPGGEARLDWSFTPERRGLYRVELRSVGSLYPFGFLRKNAAVELVREVHVWPREVDYRVFQAAGARKPSGELQLARAGSEGDMIALRRYEPGDSHRLIHWKASARSGRLLIRQFSAQSSQACTLWVRTDAELWPRADQFELMLGLATSLAQDLFKHGRLAAAAIDDAPAMPVARLADLEAFLDRLSLVEPRADSQPASAPRGRPRANLLFLEPEGTRGVAAYVDGTKTAST
jgi:uncharacterized protein (DUF58 family)